MTNQLKGIAAVLVLTVVLAGASCTEPDPYIAEQDIPVSRDVQIDYDESRLAVVDADSLEMGEADIVLSMSRAAMARYIQARSADGALPADGRYQGSLSLHQGWRQEFFPLAREVYETMYPLPEGALYHDPSPSGVYRDIGPGWVVRGRSDWFTGFLTKVVEVESDALFTFETDSDDGTLGVLQSLSGDVHDLHVVWYDWNKRSRTGEPVVTRNVPVAAGTYLLTVHYFEERHAAGYLVSMTREAAPGPDGG